MTIGSFLENNNINDFIDKYNMLEKGNGVVLGLSGGPDSVCLFFVLLYLKEKYDLSLCAVHINHCIRGKDADVDQSFVENLCKSFEVECITKRVDIPALAKQSGRGLEEEARIMRYEAFEEAANELESKSGRVVKIAVAHNADDNAETVLFHMARGCGLDGMCGIAPVRNRIIRPLLQVSKSQILELLEENEVDYCIDGTNTDIDYDRNRIRHKIVPELSAINEKALMHISLMTSQLQEVADFLSLEVNGLLAMASNEDGSLRKRTIQTAPNVIKTQALKKYISKFMPYEKDVSAVHVNQIVELLDSDGEKYIDLPHKKRFVVSYDRLFVEDMRLQDDDESADLGCDKLSNFELRVFERNNSDSFPRSNYTKWFDYDKIKSDVVIRTRQEGDYLTINSSLGKKSLQDYFVDEKIPKSKRENVPLVCDGHHVLWVVGYRISEYYKISDNTSLVLEIKYLEETNE